MRAHELEQLDAMLAHECQPIRLRRSFLITWRERQWKHALTDDLRLRHTHRLDDGSDRVAEGGLAMTAVADHHHHRGDRSVRDQGVGLTQRGSKSQGHFHHFRLFPSVRFPWSTCCQLGGYTG